MKNVVLMMQDLKEQTCQWDRVDKKCMRKPTTGGSGVVGCTMEIVCAAEDEAGQCRRCQDTWEWSALSTALHACGR